MIVHDFDVRRAGICPHKAQPPLLVDAYTVLTASIPGQGFQAIARWDGEAFQSNGGIYNNEPAKCILCNVTNRWLLPVILSLCVSEHR